VRPGTATCNTSLGMKSPCRSIGLITWRVAVQTPAGAIDIFTSVDDAGQVHVQIFRNDDETSRLREKVSRPETSFADAKPAKAKPMLNYDEIRERRAARRARRLADYAASGSNLAKDGEVLRIPLTMMDRQMMDSLRERFPPQTDAEIGEFDEEDAALALAAIRDRRRRRTVRDPFGRVLAEEEADARTVILDAYDPHRPGFRYLADRSASEQARAEMIVEMQDAWKPKDGTGSERLPPYGAIPKSLGTVKAGDACAIDGRRGRLLEDTGQRFGVNRRGGRSRNRQDAAPRMMDAATAQRIKDEAYNEMCADLVNAWRK
jgi:hypothetical protein